MGLHAGSRAAGHDTVKAKASMKTPPKLTPLASEKWIMLLAFLVVLNPVAAVVYAFWKYGLPLLYGHSM